jgi:hypothetical protein
VHCLTPSFWLKEFPSPSVPSSASLQCVSWFTYLLYMTWYSASRNRTQLMKGAIHTCIFFKMYFERCLHYILYGLKWSKYCITWVTITLFCKSHDNENPQTDKHCRVWTNNRVAFQFQSVTEKSISMSHPKTIKTQ